MTYKIAVGGYACRSHEDADLYADKYAYSETWMYATRGNAFRGIVLQDPSDEDLCGQLGKIPKSQEIRIYASMLGRYSMTTVPKILRFLAAHAYPAVLLKIEPLPEFLLEFIGTKAQVMRRKDRREMQYDVAISYAGEDQEVASRLAYALEDEGISTFFDKHEAANLWGRDLYQYFHDIYSKRTEFCVVLISEHYAANKWTRHELKAAQEKQLQNLAPYILPIRLDDTDLPGLPSTLAYLDWRNVSLESVIQAIKCKFGVDSLPYISR
ncbi:hypothetical protein ES707_16697 [subsurface metagenome]